MYCQAVFFWRDRFLVNDLLTITIKVNVPSICRISFGPGDVEMKRKIETKGVLYDILARIFGGGSGNTGSGG
jgi:hypothetical protein